jgi:phospholipase D1/2
MRSAPTGSPLSPKEPGEFPFHAVSPNTNGTTGQPSAIAEPPIRTHKASSHTSHKSNSSYYPPFAPISRQPTAEGDAADAPKERKSVQFARSTTYGTDPQSTTSRQQSWDTNDGDGKGKERDKQGSSLMGKLRALAAPMQGHGRSLSGLGGSSSAQESASHGPLSPPSERDEPRYDDSEADADGESSAGEGAASRPSRQRRKSSRRWFDGDGEGTQTAPTTPKQTGSGNFFSRDQDSPNTTPNAASANRPGFIRRGTMSDIPEHERQGYSEDEGRSRIAKESAWKRGVHGVCHMVVYGNMTPTLRRAVLNGGPATYEALQHSAVMQSMEGRLLGECAASEHQV